MLLHVELLSTSMTLTKSLVSYDLAFSLNIALNYQDQSEWLSLLLFEVFLVIINTLKVKVHDETIFFEF